MGGRDALGDVVALAFGRMLLTVALDAILGAVAGAVLAFPFSYFGGLAGLGYGLVAGLACGLLAAIRTWPVVSIVAVCAAQLMGALVVGFGMTWLDPRSGPPDHAVAGMLGGGAVGIVLAEVVRHLTLRNRAKTDGPVCPRCGYSLLGNVSGICPECGTPVERSGSGLQSRPGNEAE